jgi:phenylalanine-4-hydroxylase
MFTPPQTKTPPTYSSQEHNTWAQLYARQKALVTGATCQLFNVGFPKLGLDPLRLPDKATLSARIYQHTQWTLTDAQNGYLGPTEWFEHLAERRFPVTDYIREPHELEFTPNPDLFHEYFGHLAFFTDQAFADSAQAFGKLYLSAKTERQQLDIARLWWFSTEFGFIKEEGALKVYGAGLISSPGEFLLAMKPELPKLPFEIAKVVATAGAAYTMHTQYFVLEDYAHLNRLLSEYASSEGLPHPY